MEIQKKLLGKVALVTGGGRGLGRAYALRLAMLGADVVVNDLTMKAHQEFNEELTAPTVPDECRAMGVRSLGIEADVTDKAAVEAMVARIDQEFGRLDVLVCNAGGALFGRENPWAATASEDAYRKTIDLNLMGTIFACQAAVPIMKRHRRRQDRHHRQPGRAQVGRQRRQWPLFGLQGRDHPLHPLAGRRGGRP